MRGTDMPFGLTVSPGHRRLSLRPGGDSRASRQNEPTTLTPAGFHKHFVRRADRLKPFVLLFLCLRNMTGNTDVLRALVKISQSLQENQGGLYSN